MIFAQNEFDNVFDNDVRKGKKAREKIIDNYL